jgi:hypothetical protein
MAGLIGNTIGGAYVTVLFSRPPLRGALWFAPDMRMPSTPAMTIGKWRYDWDTVYPRALVAYVRYGGEV